MLHHHLRANRLRVSVWLSATMLVLFCLHAPGPMEQSAEQSAGPRESAPAKTAPAREDPHAAAVPRPTASVTPQVTVPPPVQATPAPATAPAPPAAAPAPRAAPKASARKGASASRSTKRPGKKRKPRYRVPGQDISWPQCPPRVGIRPLKGLAQPMPYKDITFLVIGLTNGRSFTRNPCLRMHLDWARRHHVWTAAYAFTTFPRDRQIKRMGRTGPYNGRHWLGRVQNAAWKTAMFNVQSMHDHDFRSPHIWIDVEESSSRPWPGNRRWNRAVLAAWIKAYREAGYTVGIYSSRSIWHDIMGHHRLGLPEWRTAGPASPRAALRRCRERSFQGGHGILAQWWDRRRDYDRMCPGFQGPNTMQRFFVKY